MVQNVQKYFIPDPSTYPITGSVALLLLGGGAAFWVNHLSAGPVMVAAGAAVLIYMLFGWFGKVVSESEGGKYNKQVDVSFRWAMSWFIFSEVMFFAAFFGVLFYVRNIGLPDLSGLESQAYQWPEFSARWPAVVAPGGTEPFTPMGAWGIPAINTLLLLSSGVTLTWAHWGLVAGKRNQLTVGLIMTIALGVLFLCLQGYEYAHAYSELGLKLSSGIYGSTFFMLTGFHGLHVTIGATMLTVMLFRAMAGHFRPDQHFAFEAVAWYWHFVDVVWLFLFITVYWL